MLRVPTWLTNILQLTALTREYIQDWLKGISLFGFKQLSFGFKWPEIMVWFLLYCNVYNYVFNCTGRLKFLINGGLNFSYHFIIQILRVFVNFYFMILIIDIFQAYVACSLGLQNVGLVFVCYGIVNAITAFTAGIFLKYVPRTAMMVTAAVSNIGVCIALFYWKPKIQQVSVFYILVSFWGFSDAIWQTQLSGKKLILTYILFGLLIRECFIF